MKGADLSEAMTELGIEFITGVPCSFLKPFLIELSENDEKIVHIPASHEGEALGIATGYHLATNKIPVIYLQNSGLGNIVNPLTSLASADVYGIPSLLFLTWRGEPGKNDEPQHKMMGRIMFRLLSILEIPNFTINNNSRIAKKQLKELYELARKKNIPVAAVFQRDTLTGKACETEFQKKDVPTREDILKVLLQKIGDSPTISTTGKTSREVYEIRKRLKQSHKKDFLTVGSMGHVASIGLGISLNTERKTFIIDGDGSLIMKMGTLTTIGRYGLNNFIHIVIDNGSYESTGGQPTNSTVLNWKKLFFSTGYKEVRCLKTLDDVNMLSFESMQKPAAIVIKSKMGSRSDLGRPSTSPMENKLEFMDYLCQ